MVQAAISVVLFTPCPAENTLDPVEINGRSTCRAEKRLWNHNAADGKCLHHFNPVSYIRGRYGFQGRYKSGIMSTRCDTSKKGVNTYKKCRT